MSWVGCDLVRHFAGEKCARGVGRRMVGAMSYPDNPVMMRRLRGGFVESQHRGAWVLVDGGGSIIDGAGAMRGPVFARSSTKAFQVLPLVEAGAADRFGFSEVELALCVASHNAEDCHTRPIAGLLGRLGLSSDDLKCGAMPPGDPKVRRALASMGESPSALHHNCSGKHAGFLALALHMGVAANDYIGVESAGQKLVIEVLRSMCDLEADELQIAVDGCSAPTFRLPLHKLAMGMARVADPGGLEGARAVAAERVMTAVCRHPELIAGNHKRLCTDLLRVTNGRLFAKIGAEAVYVIGVRGADRGFALKMDDGSLRLMNFVVVQLLFRLGLLERNEYEALGAWTDSRLFNDAGLEIGERVVL